MTKKILIVVFGVIILAGLTVMFNLENQKVGSLRYYRVEYTEKLDSANNTILSDESKLEEKLLSLNYIYESTEYAVTLEDSTELSAQEKAMIKIFTIEELKQSLKYSEMILEDNVHLENTSSYGQLKNLVSEVNEYVNSFEKEISITEGLLYSLFCITVVFGVLILLWFIVDSFKYFSKTPAKVEIKKEQIIESKPLRLEDITDPDMMVAALVATIDYSNSGARDVKLVNIKEVVE